MARPPDSVPPQPRPRTGAGLRLRLWFACLSGGLIASAGTLWLLATPSLSPSDPAVYGWLAGVACASLVLGLILALWVDHHIVGHLHGLLLGLRSGRVAELRGLPAGTGWGELSELGDAVQETLEHRRKEARAILQLERMREHLSALQASIDRWQLTERWERPAIPDGEPGEVAEVLTHAIQRRVVVDEQNRDAARQVANELGSVIGDAQEAASQAERGFVEATSLQTSVREIHRLSTELAAALTRVAAAETAAAPDPAAERAREALQELVEASSRSVESLGRGLLRVQDISEQVQRIANRSTLIGIQALSGTGEPEVFAAELKQLAHDVREATDRTTAFAQDIDRAVSDSDARMREARERAIARLEAPVPAPAKPAASAAPAPDVQRLVERVLEMVRDAITKGERVSTASERASSTAEKLMRRLEGNVSDADALVVRLAPVGEALPLSPPAPALELRLVDPAEGEERHDDPGATPREEERP
jgi:methyl-accepting chemotaxis protein